ncbi:MAG: class II fructose-bisphosphate aldolase [Acidobacteriota bacterium]
MSEASEGLSESNSRCVSARKILDAVRLKGRAVAALNFYNAETLRAHIMAATALRAPLILQTTESTINYLGLRLAVAMARAAAEDTGQLFALHLDHGASYELAARCIDAGYTSVMIDGSKLAFADNIALTRRVVDLAHAAGVSVEGELGHVAHNDEGSDPSRFYTDPEAARQFVNETQVDALAVAIGTAHGFYKGDVHLDFERLRAIRDAVGATPLVLHGGSGVEDKLLTEAIDSGIAKINFGTEIKNTFTRAVKASLLSSDEIDLRKTFLPAIDAVREVSAAKIRICQRNPD